MSCCKCLYCIFLNRCYHHMIYYVTKSLRTSVKRKNNPYSANTLTLGTTVNQTIEQKMCRKC